jgi:hypothetical protein
MRKFNPKYLYTAAASAAVMAAVIAIPSWAASGGGDSTAQGQATAPAPAYGLTRANAPSAAQMRQNRAKLDEFASCLKDHGVDGPTPGSTGQPPQPPSSSEQKEITKDCGTPPAPPPGLPPLSGKQADAARKAMAKGDCPLPPALPVPPSDSSGSGS